MEINHKFIHLRSRSAFSLSEGAILINDLIELCKKDILTFDNENGIKPGPAYKTIYKKFVSQTTIDISALVKKWKHSGALDKLLELDKKYE